MCRHCTCPASVALAGGSVASFFKTLAQTGLPRRACSYIDVAPLAQTGMMGTDINARAVAPGRAEHRQEVKLCAKRAAQPQPFDEYLPASATCAGIVAAQRRWRWQACLQAIKRKFLYYQDNVFGTQSSCHCSNTPIWAKPLSLLLSHNE